MPNFILLSIPVIIAVYWLVRTNNPVSKELFFCHLGLSVVGIVILCLIGANQVDSDGSSIKPYLFTPTKLSNGKPIPPYPAKKCYSDCPTDRYVGNFRWREGNALLESISKNLKKNVIFVHLPTSTKETDADIIRKAWKGGLKDDVVVVFSTEWGFKSFSWLGGLRFHEDLDKHLAAVVMGQAITGFDEIFSAAESFIQNHPDYKHHNYYIRYRIAEMEATPLVVLLVFILCLTHCVVAQHRWRN